MIGASGALDFAVPIPNSTKLSGAVLYSQAVMHSPVLSKFMLTNAYAVSIGR